MTYELWLNKTIINDNKNHNKVFMNWAMSHGGEAQTVEIDDSVQGFVWRVRLSMEERLKFQIQNILEFPPMAMRNYKA